MTKCHLLLFAALLPLFFACKPSGETRSLSEYGARSQATQQALFEQYVQELKTLPLSVAFRRQDSVMDAAERDSAEWQRMTKLQEQRLPPLRPCLLNNRVSKVVRIRRLGSYLTSRKLHFLNTPHNRLLIEQMRHFPVGDHDDGPDALEMAIRLLNQLIGERHFDDGLGSNLLHRRG